MRYRPCTYMGGLMRCRPRSYMKGLMRCKPCRCKWRSVENNKLYIYCFIVLKVLLLNTT